MHGDALWKGAFGWIRSNSVGLGRIFLFGVEDDCRMVAVAPKLAGFWWVDLAPRSRAGTARKQERIDWFSKQSRGFALGWPPTKHTGTNHAGGQIGRCGAPPR